MKDNILDACFFKDAIKVLNDMWLKGWAERNGGNLSYRLTKEEVEKYIDDTNNKGAFDLPQAIPDIENEYFLITGTGKYFRNMIIAPNINLGIIKIIDGGKKYSIIWGYDDGGKPTSEASAHLKSHAVRKKITNDKNRVIIHTHATNLIALTYVEDLDYRSFSKRLWQMSTECLVVFPEGVGVLPWMVAGTNEIGDATANLMTKHRLVLWAFHGIFGAGESIDEAMGLIDTAEKAANILVKVNSMGDIKQKITDEEFKRLADFFNVMPDKDIINY